MNDADAVGSALHGSPFTSAVVAAVVGICLASLGGCVPWSELRSEPDTGFIDRAVVVGGTEYRYAIYVPREVRAYVRGYMRGDERTALPLVVFLHGMGECGTDGSKPLAVGLAPAIMLEPERWKCVALFPQKPTQKSQWEDHEAAVVAMVDAAKSEFAIDPRRMYLTGLSQGGHGSWEIGARNPEMWAAVAPLCGYGDPASIAARWKSTPVWAFHGLKDNVVPPAQSESLVAALVAAGRDAKYTAFPDENHNCWDKAYRGPELARWLFAQHRD